MNTEYIKFKRKSLSTQNKRKTTQNIAVLTTYAIPHVTLDRFASRLQFLNLGYHKYSVFNNIK